jgi:acyl-coenzyme A synthetase/AMP-(fatty) acid ligase/thioesterase domain-containing protein/acyl carrier protein
VNSVAVMEQTRGAAQSARLQWLDDDPRPLDWNGPTGRPFTRFRDEDLDRPIVELLERVARRYPHRTAVTDSETSLSYAELWDGVSGLAEAIAAQTRPGALIGIDLPACSMYPLAMLACLAAGRPFVALDPQYPGDWLRQVLEDARPALIIGREDLRSVPRAAGSGWRPVELGVDQPACMLFTSGSTGRPKGIVNSQRNLLQRAAQSINAAHINADDRFLTLASLCTIVGVRDTLTALLAGASIHLLDAQRVGAREILNVIRAETITILFAFPALLRSVIPHGGERAGEALRLVRVGGDTTLWSDIDLLRGWLAPGAAIQSIYAATEAPMMQWFVDASYRADDLPVPIGYPLPGNRLAVIDEDGRTTPPGDIGELVVESPYVALGLQRFRTGDLVRQRPDGLLERIGRKDSQVKIRGTRVDLDGVEAALRRHPLVRDVGVVARAAITTSGSDGGVTLVAYVTACDAPQAAGYAKASAPTALLDDLKEMMRSVPPAMRPGRFYLVDTIPRLPGSKLDRPTLMARDEANVRNERANVGVEDPAADAIARAVAGVWRLVLETPVLGPDDDFFDAGGDSLKAITFVMELERALGLDLPLTLVTETPTFAGLCECLRVRQTSHYVPLVPLKPGDTSPPIFIVHGLGGTVAGLLPTARRTNYAGAVIGIQARGLNRGESPHSTIEAMADEYLRAVKVRQPEGPYYLCGYSFGGLVAFEMARRLLESGEDVALVGLFDTMMSPLQRPLASWVSIARRRIVQFASGGRISERPRSVLKSRPIRVIKVSAHALIASARYRPGFYPGELTLFTPEEREPGLPPLQTVWRPHARTLTVIETAGDHTTMFSATNAESTAATLTRAIGFS